MIPFRICGQHIKKRSFIISVLKKLKELPYDYYKLLQNWFWKNFRNYKNKIKENVIKALETLDQSMGG